MKHLCQSLLNHSMAFECRVIHLSVLARRLGTVSTEIKNLFEGINSVEALTGHT